MGDRGWCCGGVVRRCGLWGLVGVWVCAVVSRCCLLVVLVLCGWHWYVDSALGCASFMCGADIVSRVQDEPGTDPAKGSVCLEPTRCCDAGFPIVGFVRVWFPSVPRLVPPWARAGPHPDGRARGIPTSRNVGEGTRARLDCVDLPGANVGMAGGAGAGGGSGDDVPVAK